MMRAYSGLISFVLIFSALLVDAKAQRQNATAKITQQKKKGKSQKLPARPANTMGTKLGTDFNFDGMAVRGKYQSAFEGQATVENEKPIEDLMNYRSHFSDRMAAAKEQR